MKTAQAYSVVHIENSFASGQKKRPRGPRSEPSSELTSDPRAIPTCTPLDLNTFAVAYYVRHHLQILKETPDILKNPTEFLLPKWKPEAQSPILDLAVSSKALAVFSRTQRCASAAIEASAKYQQLLRIAHETILHLNKDNVDACLLAIFFMSRYEDAIYQPLQHQRQIPFLSTLQSLSHHDGAFAVLRIWKDRLSHISPATDIIKHTRRCFIKSAILRNLTIPHWMLEGTFFGEDGLDLEYDRTIVQIINIRHQLFTLLQGQQIPQPSFCKLTSIAEELSKETVNLEEALQQWTTHFPSTWSYKRHTIPNADFLSKRHIYSPVVFSFSSPAYAAVWAKYFATRMLIISTRLTSLKLIQPGSKGSARQRCLECQSDIEITASDLASSLPFCLQRFSVTKNPNLSSHQDLISLNKRKDIEPHIAALIIWPLSLASSLKNVNHEQKRWFKFELACLGKIVGVSMLEYAETNQWPEL